MLSQGSVWPSHNSAKRPNSVFLVQSITWALSNLVAVENLEEPLRTINETSSTKRRLQPVSISIYFLAVKSAWMGISTLVLNHGLRPYLQNTKLWSTYLHEHLVGASIQDFPATLACLDLLRYPFCFQYRWSMAFLLRICNQDTGRFWNLSLNPILEKKTL